MLTAADWLSLFLGSIVIPAGLYFLSFLLKWWRQTRPAYKVLGGICEQSESCKVFVRDLILEENSQVLAFEPRVGFGRIPNIQKLYAEVEGRGIANIFNVLGQVGKTVNVEIMGFGEDIRGEWNSHVILLGAQAQKHFDFYRFMENVAYRMNGQNIYNALTNVVVPREEGFGYGIILKAANPMRTGKKGAAFLLGGFGVLGTIAATYYFRENFRQLGKDFGSDCFGVVVRAPVTAGEEAVERLKEYDMRFRTRRWPWLQSKHDKRPSFGDQQPVDEQPKIEEKDQPLRNPPDLSAVIGLHNALGTHYSAMPTGTSDTEIDFVGPAEVRPTSVSSTSSVRPSSNVFPPNTASSLTSGSDREQPSLVLLGKESPVSRAESEQPVAHTQPSTTKHIYKSHRKQRRKKVKR